jgi:hypothetical protein
MARSSRARVADRWAIKARTGGIKLGGYPLLIQSTAFLMTLDPDFQLQVDATSLYTSADSGIGYICDNLTSAIWETM